MKITLDSKAIDNILDFSMKRFNENSKLITTNNKETQAKLICAGLYDYLCAQGITPNFEMESMEDIEEGSLEELC